MASENLIRNKIEQTFNTDPQIVKIGKANNNRFTVDVGNISADRENEVYSVNIDLYGIMESSAGDKLAKLNQDTQDDIKAGSKVLLGSITLDYPMIGKADEFFGELGTWSIPLINNFDEIVRALGMEDDSNMDMEDAVENLPNALNKYNVSTDKKGKETFTKRNTNVSGANSREERYKDVIRSIIPFDIPDDVISTLIDVSPSKVAGILIKDVINELPNEDEKENALSFIYDDNFERVFGRLAYNATIDENISNEIIAIGNDDISDSEKLANMADVIEGNMDTSGFADLENKLKEQFGGRWHASTATKGIGPLFTGRGEFSDNSDPDSRFPWKIEYTPMVGEYHVFLEGDDNIIEGNVGSPMINREVSMKVSGNEIYGRLDGLMYGQILNGKLKNAHINNAVFKGYLNDGQSVVVGRVSGKILNGEIHGDSVTGTINAEIIGKESDADLRRNFENKLEKGRHIKSTIYLSAITYMNVDFL